MYCDVISTHQRCSFSTHFASCFAVFGQLTVSYRLLRLEEQCKQYINRKPLYDCCFTSLAIWQTCAKKSVLLNYSRRSRGSSSNSRMRGDRIFREVPQPVRKYSTDLDDKMRVMAIVKVKNYAQK